MKLFLVLSLISLNTCAQKTIELFDGKTFANWEGDTVKTWRISNGEIIGGSLLDTVPHNEFLASTKEYGNFILKLKFKLSGTEGFINAGVQFHSKRVSDPPYEMTGYQADLGDGYWASLYDETRRNKVLAHADSNIVRSVLKKNDWNDYEIRAENGRIRIFLNGQQTVDYTEEDPGIPQRGLIALQIHGDGKAEVRYREVVVMVEDENSER